MPNYKEVDIDKDLWNPTDKQLEATEATSQYKYILYGGAMGGGKILGDNDVVLTPFNWKLGKDLKIGDNVNNPDGSIQKIIQIKPRVILDKWIVNFLDGTSAEVAADHLWQAWRGQKTRKKNNIRIAGEKSAETVETQEMKKWIDSGYNVLIPVCKEQHFNRINKNTLDSYLLGLLLGDGCVNNNVVRISSSIHDIKEYLEEIGSYDVSIYNEKTLAFTGDRRKQLRKQLDSLGLLNSNSDNKFIPEAYKWDTVENRYWLVRGLMDTDGYTAPNKNACYYTTISKQLGEDMAFMLRSLGAYVSIRKKKTYCDGVRKSDAYELYIKHRSPDLLFNLSRKKDIAKKFRRDEIAKRIVSISIKGKITGRCITVSNPNGLYITNDFIVTHNSYWLRWQLIDLLLYWASVGYKGVRVGLFCEDYPSLKDRQISKVQIEFPAYLGHLNKADYEYQLAPEYGGGVICFRNLDDSSKYQSAEFAAIAIDELTKNKYETFTYLRTRLRWPGIKCPKFLAATNPGGIGHVWVKKIWMDQDFEPGEKEADLFHFIPAKAIDNKHLTQSYYDSLEGLPADMKRAFVEGDWNIFKGQFFTEWRDAKHVIEPFAIPESWPKFRSIDPSGRGGITSCHWYTLDWNKNVYVYREHYGTGMDADQHAKEIYKLSEGEDYKYTVIDSAAFSKVGLPETISEVYERCGVTGLVTSSKNRVHGWTAVHRYLRWTETELPLLRVFRTCTNLINTLPSLIYDKNRVDDVDSDGEDHAADELRYFLQTLRDQHPMQPKNKIEQYLEKLKQQEENFNFNYNKQ